jgi:hypothetical protein
MDTLDLILGGRLLRPISGGCGGSDADAAGGEGGVSGSDATGNIEGYGGRGGDVGPGGPSGGGGGTGVGDLDRDRSSQVESNPNPPDQPSSPEPSSIDRGRASQAPNLDAAPSIDRGRASIAGATGNPDVTALGGTPVDMVPGFKDPTQAAMGGLKIVGGIVTLSPGLVTSGVQDVVGSRGPVPGPGSVTAAKGAVPGGETGLLDPGQNDRFASGGASIGAFTDHPENAPMLTPPAEPAPAPAPEEGGEEGDGGGGDGGDTGIPKPPALPPVPNIPMPPGIPTETGEGPATDSTRDVIKRAQQFGRDSTLLTGAEGSGFGDTQVPGATPPGGPSRSGTLTPTPATREGTRVPRVSQMLDRQDRANQDTARTEIPAQGPPGAPSDTGTQSGPDVPSGYTLVRDYSTLPYQLIRDQNGNLWIRNTTTGDVVPDMALAPEDASKLRRGGSLV